MSDNKYTLGIDFGTESGRAVLVETRTGKEIATSIYPYENGVIDKKLPIDGAPVQLEPEWHCRIRRITFEPSGRRCRMSCLKPAWILRM